MSNFTLIKKNPTQGEITSSLTGSTGDGAGLHFDGAAGNIDVASPPDLGTAFSFEFVASSSQWNQTAYFVDFNTGGRFIFGALSGELSIYDTTGTKSFGVKVLDDLKVHHLVVTVDGTSATLYDNGNQVATTTISTNHDIHSCTDATIGPGATGSPSTNLTLYRCRFYNKALTSAEVQTAYERADVDFADQYGSQTETSTNSFVNSGFAGFSGNAAGFTTTGSASNNAVYKNQTFTAGKKYRLKFTIADGNSSNLLLLFRSSTGGAGANVGKIDSSNLGTVVSDTYLQLEATGNYELILSDLGSAQSIRVYAGGDVGAINISAFSIVQIGCVSDYDLAFASPTQSLTVQDRSGAADGTCSASGVTQVQPVVQLNSTSARIGTSAATPADGELLASGNIGSGSADPNIGGWGNAITIDNSGAAALEFAKSGTLYGFVGVQGSGSGNAFDVAAYQSQDMRFRVGSNAGTTAMSIDSTGKLSCVNDITIQKNNGNLVLHGTADGSQQAVLFRNDSDEDKGFIKYRDTYSSAGGNTMEVGTNGTTRLTLDDSGTAKISKQQQTTDGTPFSGAALKLLPSDTTNSTGVSSIALSTSTVENYGFLISGHRTGGDGTPTLRVSSHNNSNTGTEVLQITNAGLATFSGGINLGDTNLSNYAEGTWTPSVGGDATYSVQSGRYTRVGRLVTATWDMTISVIGTGSTYIVSGLPFNSGDSIGGGGSITYYSSLAISPVLFAPTVGGGTVHIRSATSAVANPSNHGILGNGSRIAGIVTYTV